MSDVDAPPTYPAGQSVLISAAFSEGGVAFNPNTVTLKYRKPDGTEVSVAQVALTNPSVGTWTYYVPTAITETGVWTYRFEGIRTLNPATFVIEEGFITTSLEGDPADPTPGKPALRPCSAWITDVTKVASDVALDTELRELICDGASEIIWKLSGRQFGTCQATVRPCQPTVAMRYPSWMAWYPGYTYPGLPPIIGWFLSTSCGCGSDGVCGCTVTSEIILPRKPVVSVDQVKVDGVVLVKGVDYRVDDFSRLVRLNPNSLSTWPTWPLYQNLDLDDTQVNTMSVQFTFGRPIPPGGYLSARLLAEELLKASAGGDCALPDRVTTLVREGVTLQLLDPSNYMDKGKTGIKAIDLWLQAVNPKGLQNRARIFRADSLATRYRRTNT